MSLCLIVALARNVLALFKHKKKLKKVLGLNQSVSKCRYKGKVLLIKFLYETLDDYVMK